MRRKNLFSIGRRDGDENQLTEMLAYLLQEEQDLTEELLSRLELPMERGLEWQVETQRAIPSGFLDLVAFVPGKAIVILESKLGSTTDHAQLSKYIDYAASLPVTGLRALIFSTRQQEDWPAGIKEHARSQGVLLVRRRWQFFADALAPSRRQLADDFTAMLREEGLVHPQPLTTADWETWREGNRITRVLSSLLGECDELMVRVAPGFKKKDSVVISSSGKIYRCFRFEGLTIWVCFWPSRKPSDPQNHALVNVNVLNTALPESERKSRGKATVELVRLPNVAMSGWAENDIVHSQPTHEVLTADDFLGQRDQLVNHVETVIAFFREVGYLPQCPTPDERTLDQRQPGEET